jgi:hypothetical protein
VAALGRPDSRREARDSVGTDHRFFKVIDAIPIGTQKVGVKPDTASSPDGVAVILQSLYENGIPQSGHSPPAETSRRVTMG